MRISDWSSDVCSSDLAEPEPATRQVEPAPQILHGNADLAETEPTPPAPEQPVAAERQPEPEPETPAAAAAPAAVETEVVPAPEVIPETPAATTTDRKSTRLNSSH